MLFQEFGDVTFCMTLQYRISMSDLLGSLKSYRTDMSKVKGKRVGDLQDISPGIFISLTKIISKERMKVLMANLKLFLRVLWERVIMYTSKDVRTYYTLLILKDNYSNTIIYASLRELMWNCLYFIKEDTLL